MTREKSREYVFLETEGLEKRVEKEKRLELGFTVLQTVCTETTIRT